MRQLISALRIILSIGALGVTGLALAAVLGFAVPAFDLLNHLQFFLFAGTLFSLLVITPLLGRGNWRRFMLAATATGFMASAIMVVPEAVASFQPRDPLPTDGRPVIKVMTHNLFGLNYDMDRVLQVIEEEQPDILAFQEYFGEQRSELGPKLQAQYPYSVYCRGGKRANLGLYSRIPFTQEQAEACPDNAYGEQRTGHILALFELSDGTKFSVMTTHLDWPAPKMERQREEFASLVETVRSTTGPLVLVGDFNSTSWSYALREFAREAGLVREDRNMLTYPALFYYLGGWRRTLPFLPLDHVMTRDIDIHDMHTADRTGSDHLPVVFTFSVAK